MGLFDKLKETINVATGKTAPDLSQLTPEQRARYEASMAQAEQGQAQAQQALVEAEQRHVEYQAAEAERRVFHGTPAAYLYGEAWTPPSPMELERIRAEQGMRAMIAASRPPGGTTGQLRDAARDGLGLREGPPELDDPQQRQQVAAQERAARDAARAPYRSPHAVPLTISRIATRGDSQIEELLAFLGSTGLAGRPDLVWGVSRVPDRISPMLTPSSEKGRVVEWDVIHVPGELPPAPVAPAAAFFSSRQQWIARRLGEPGVLDEDLGRAYGWAAGIGPESCLGIARFPHFRADNRNESAFIQTWVEGVYVLHRPGPNGHGVAEQLQAAAPLPLDIGQLEPSRTEILDWESIAAIVHPQRQRPQRVPNPVPQLPSTPQELLGSYLEVVGVQPGDCWSAQVTVDENQELAGRSGFISHNAGPELPCADGKPRRRLHGAQQVVIVYRDRPEYAAGRERWQAYQHDVLEARLDRGSERRPVLVSDDWNSPILRALETPFRVYEWLEDLGMTTPPPRYRYCWPPVSP
jgi:hypothetical protein